MSSYLSDVTLVCGRHTAHLSFLFFDSTWVLTEALQLFCTDTLADFGLLQSSIHEAWARKYSSTIGEVFRYSTSDSFDTLPLPQSTEKLFLEGRTYYEFRRELMLSRQEGLTKIYNRFHDPDEHSSDIGRLRLLHIEMDRSVADAYGWGDLELGHGFCETKQGLRFIMSDFARRAVLDRLLALNHVRFEDEVRAGLHDKKGKKVKSTDTTSPRELKAAGSNRHIAETDLFGQR